MQNCMICAESNTKLFEKVIVLKTLRAGFLHGVQLMLQIEEGGLCCAGPPCGSFVFLNMATSGRTKTKPMGGKRSYVKAANKYLPRS